MKIKFVLVTVLALSIIFSCSKNEKETIKQNPQTQVSSAHEVVVQEVIQVSEYTYLRVKEGTNEYWIAAPKADIKEGTVITFNKSMEMKNFESKELKRKFDSILFVDNLDAKLGTGSMNTPIKPNIEKENIKIEKPADAITIAELFANPSKYENKIVKIKGKVVKLNSGIMNKNWLHIQDGTSYKNDFDLTVTSNQLAGKDEIITVTGRIILNKDFGYGYSYKILMEDASIDGAKKSNKMLSM